MYYNKGRNLTSPPRAQKILEPGLREAFAEAVFVFTMSAQEHRARPVAHANVECQASERRSKTKYQRVVCLVLSSLAFSASHSLSFYLAPAFTGQE